MQVFNTIEISWKGEDLKISDNAEIFRLIGKIEEIATISEWQLYLESGNVPMSKLCAAYALVIQFAGKPEVTELEVYGNFASLSSDIELMKKAIATIVLWCLPKDVVDQAIEAAKDQENDVEGKKQKNSQNRNTKKGSKRQKQKVS